MCTTENIIDLLENDINNRLFYTNNNEIFDKYKDIIQDMEQDILREKPQLNKVRKSLKNLLTTGHLYSESQQELSSAIDGLFSSQKTEINSDSADLHDSELGFVRLGVLLREFSKLQQSMLTSASASLLPLIDSLLVSLHNIKHDKSIERCFRLVESKLTSVRECEGKADSSGVSRTVCDLADSHKLLYSNICEFVAKLTSANIRRGNVLPLAFCDFFDRNRRMTEEQLDLYGEIDSFMKKTRICCQKLKSHYSTHKDRISKVLDVVGKGVKKLDVYEMEKPKVKDSVAYSKAGYLMKKNEGFMRSLTWAKRRCSISDGKMLIHHSTETKQPVVLDLVACELKVSAEDKKNKQFQVYHGGSSRVYLFKAGTSQMLDEWTLVFNNAKSAAFDKAFVDQKSHRLLVRSIDETVRLECWRLGQISCNSACVDCGDVGCDWISVNLGVFLCLRCCGIHRELGVHVSRTCSLSLDDIGTFHLLIVSAIGNEMFNSVYSALLLDPLIDPTSNMDERREFITAKYVERRYVETPEDGDTWLTRLRTCISDGLIGGVLSLHGQGYKLMVPLDPECASAMNNSLVLAISCGDSSLSLAIIDLIAQNTQTDSLNTKFADYESVFHFALLNNHVNALQILLRVCPHALDTAGNLWRIASQVGNTRALRLLSAIRGRDSAVIHNFMRHGDSVSNLSTMHSRETSDMSHFNLVRNMFSTDVGSSDDST